MATLKIDPGGDGTHSVWVTLTRFCDEDLARVKKVPGHQWNPERKQWRLPEPPATRAALAEIVAMPPAPLPTMITVKLKQPGTLSSKPRHRYIAGEGKPLTTHPPHPLIRWTCVTSKSCWDAEVLRQPSDTRM